MKPADFFVGVVEFFSILLPGAFVTFALTVPAATLLFDGSHLPSLNNQKAAEWIVFAFSSYVIGHFVFQVGSLLDESYHLYRRRKAGNRGFFRKADPDKPSGDGAYLEASRRKREEDLIPDHVASCFKWSVSYIRARSQAAAAVVDGLEASQKFFRSMVVALLIYAVILLSEGKLSWADRRDGVAVVLALAAVSYWRYAELRWKMTQAAYLYYLQIRTLSGKDPGAK